MVRSRSIGRTRSQRPALRLDGAGTGEIPNTAIRRRVRRGNSRMRRSRAVTLSSRISARSLWASFRGRMMPRIIHTHDLPRRRREKRFQQSIFRDSPSAMLAELGSLRMPDNQWWQLGINPTSPSLRWVQKMLGVRQWQDVRKWDDAVHLWFPACRVG